MKQRMLQTIMQRNLQKIKQRILQKIKQRGLRAITLHKAVKDFKIQISFIRCKTFMFKDKLYPISQYT